MSVEFGKLKFNKFFLASLENRGDANFFANQEKQQHEEEKKQQPSAGRLNDYDSNILEEKAYMSLSDEMLKLEHRIGLLEKMLNKLNSEIEVLESFGYMVQITDLKLRREKIEDELVELNKVYASLGISAKISNQIASAMSYTSNKQAGFISTLRYLAISILAKVSKKYNYSQTMKDLLSKLTNINSNVDELVTMKVPYGEKVNRYEKLTAYLNKANSIHAQISKDMKDIVKETKTSPKKVTKKPPENLALPPTRIVQQTYINKEMKPPL